MKFACFNSLASARLSPALWVLRGSRNRHNALEFSRSVHVQTHALAVAAEHGTKSRAAPSPSKDAAAKPEFTQQQRFVVSKDAQLRFEAAWDERHRGMQDAKGFVGFEMDQNGDAYTVRSHWASIPDWEAYNLSLPCRRSHLPTGVWQLVPKPGEGFPEDFIPFADMTGPVQARYPPKKKGGK